MTTEELKGFLNLAGEIRPIDTQTTDPYEWDMRDSAADAIEELVAEVQRLEKEWHDHD